MSHPVCRTADEITIQICGVGLKTYPAKDGELSAWLASGGCIESIWTADHTPGPPRWVWIDDEHVAYLVEVTGSGRHRILAAAAHGAAACPTD